MWNSFYRNPRLLILTTCLIVVWGLLSFNILPRTEEPPLSQYWGVVVTRFPGASAARVESLVSERIEQTLFELKEVESLDSTSTEQLSSIAVRLKPNVRDTEQVWSKLRDRLSDVAPLLPPGALTPEYRDVEPRAYNLIVTLPWVADSPPNYGVLHRWGRELETLLQNLEGTETVDVFGEPTEEILVEVQPETLSSVGITPAQVAQQIQASDAKVPAGQLRGDRNNLLLELDTQLDTLERIRQIPIQTQATGQTTQVGNLAFVSKGIREPPSSTVLTQGQPAVAIAARMELSRRIDDWVETVYPALEEFRQTLPRDLDLQVIFDQSQYVEERLNHLLLNLLLGALCVCVTTLLMMGWRSALVVSVALPLSVCLVFGGMNVLQISLNQMSLMGLVVALGLLIDNAIVVVDELKHKLDQGHAPASAITQSSRQLAVPLLASTLTTTLTFLPIALIPGETGEFVQDLAYSVILALLGSLLLSLTIIPALKGYSYARQGPQTSSGGNGNHSIAAQRTSLLARRWQNGFSHEGLANQYRQLLRLVLQRPWVGIGIALIWPLVGFAAFTTLPEQFFPPAERDQFYVELDLTPSSPLAQTQAAAQRAQEIMQRHSEVDAVHWFIGSNLSTFYYNLPQSGRETENLASGIVQINDAASSRQLIRTLQTELDQQLPEAQVLVRQIEQGIFIAAPITLRIYGEDFSTLSQLGQQVREQLVRVEQITHTRASLNNIIPQLSLNLDETQAQLTGVNPAEIAQQLNMYLGGSVGGSVLEETEELAVRVRLSSQDQQDLAKISTLDLVSTQGLGAASPLPLSSLGQMQLLPELATISRYNSQRVNTIHAYVEAGSLPNEVLKAFQQQLENSDFTLPPGYRLEFDGEAAERNEVLRNLAATVGPILIVMAGTLILSLRSFRAASMIFMVGIGSVGLALASLWLFAYPLGLMAILGTIGLIGVAINDSIVVMAALRSDSAAQSGNLQAIENIVVRSTRHVLATTFTTVAGFIPLLVAGGEFWPPLGICIAGGVGGATLLALLFIPCTHLLMSRKPPPYQR